MLPTRDCGCRSSLVFSVCLVSRHRHQWFRRRRPGARCSDHSFLARTRKGLGSGRDPTLRIPANTSSLPSASTADLLERTESWAGPGPGNGPKEEVMTNRADQWKRRALFIMLLVLPGLAGCTSAMPAASEPPGDSDVDVDPWPRQLASGDNTFSLFQPQYESWDQGRLSGRAAVAVENRVSSQPKYGVIRFAARTEVDKEARMVTLEDVTVSKADFPSTPDDGAAYLAALQQILSGQPLTIALDRLQAELEVERVEDPSRIVQVKNDPPRIIVSQGPAVLVRIDGQPVLREGAGTGLLPVSNTRGLLLLDRSAGRYYFWLMNRWLAAPKLDGPWAVLANPPASLGTAQQAAVQSGQVDLLDKPAPEFKQLLQTGAIPAIYVSTVPAELIVLRGQPALAPIAATDILQVTNTDDDLFLYSPQYTPQQEDYLLLSV